MRIALTGATGAVGRLVAAELADLRPLLLGRDPSRLTDLGGGVARFDYAQADASVLAGVDVLLLVSGAEAADRRDQHRRAVAAAAEAGVGHVVYTSFLGAAPDATFTLGRDHADTEAALRDSGCAWTFLRDGFYADLLPFFADDAGVLRGPAGDGRVSAVARADVAACASAVLRSPAPHAGVAYELTGPEALTLTEVAARAGAVLGRTLRFEDETVEQAYASRRAAYPDAPDWQLDAWVSTYTAIAEGSQARVSPDVERLTGHPARTLEQALRG
ncbi:NAD(P)H-binding protein [Nocardioides sp. TRM66260-LWL]|uniref:NAD(P)H-binding protein n=1 Tax=Nocardioides sp. TRM66260-LWL TaxID=2874478 RepID=UPI001CC6C482|nr:NAD(P)H-binding protein [Nocardioides sp. TRM66260-LWL]MBZ5734813.1 NAD(P)H-binding protein [Nocardioides sp. TRM66260-LWL]